MLNNNLSRFDEVIIAFQKERFEQELKASQHQEKRRQELKRIAAQADFEMDGRRNRRKRKSS